MFNAQDLLGQLLQGGLSPSTGSRVERAMGPQGVGGQGGLLGQLLGGAGGAPAGGASSGGGLGDLLSGLSGALGGAGRTAGGNPLAMGGIGALAGAVLGRGDSTVGNAIGGGALALLGTMAWQALQKAGQQQGAAAAAAPEEAPLGVRPPQTPQEEAVVADKATLMLLAMISAAKADGQIDGSEMQKIVGGLEQAGADPEARDFVLQELKKPLDLDALVRQVPDAAVGAEVYAASLLAIEVDTPAEQAYLQQLAAGLGLAPAAVAHLHDTLGAPKAA